MEDAVAKFGGGEFEVPENGQFIKIDRVTGERLPNDAEGEQVVAEFFREGEEPIFGQLLDGGFALGSTLSVGPEEGLGGQEVITIETPDGALVQIPRRANFGELSTGGLY